MATIVTRAGKGSPLTNTEVDNNFTNLNTDKLEKSGGTMTGDLSFGDNNKAIFGAGSDLQIYHDGSNSIVNDSGTGSLLLQGNNLYLQNAAGTEYYVVCLPNEGVNLRYDNAIKLATTSTGIDVTGNVVSDGASLDGAVVINESGADVDFRIESDTDANAFFLDGTNGRIGIGTSSPSSLLHLDGNYPKITLNDTQGVQRAFSVGTNNETFTIRDETNSADSLVITNSDYVGIGTSSPASKLDVVGDVTIQNTQASLILKDTNSGTIGTANTKIKFQHSGGTEIGYIGFNGDGSGGLEFASNTAERMRINTDGTLTTYYGSAFNENGGDYDFRVESDTNTHALFVDAGNSRVGVQTNAPGTALDVFCASTGSDGIRITATRNAALQLYGADTSIQAGETSGFIQWITADTNNPGVHGQINVTATNTNGSGEMQLWSGTAPSIVKNIVLRGDTAVFNEDSADVDFRVESDAHTHAFDIDGATSMVSSYLTRQRPLYSGSFPGASYATVVDLNSFSGGSTTIGCKIRATGSENGYSNTSYGEWIAVRTYSGGYDHWALQLVSQVTSGNTYGQVMLQMSNSNLQVKSGSGVATGNYRISLDFFY